MVNNSNPGGNIFLTTENLAFAMPLLLLCGSYAYFKYLPLEYSLPGVGIVGAILFFQAQTQARKNEKLSNLDEATIRDIVGEEEEEDIAKGKPPAKGKSKAQKERKNKKNGKQSGQDDNDDDDGDDDLQAFAKGSRGKQKKR
ncbi:expressed unknown protein [Seminavis robusta]|uniref:Uncharacterized protein n=1 Tax=Seminavis robusta TaxID=568900 RepID=A0A9N8DEM5_9STRA|nr:expressed unknown protein [Seminavis robusta]|eukprot:Sro58_g033600.1 n/a (142) ;mRNA; f:21338-21863